MSGENSTAQNALVSCVLSSQTTCLSREGGFVPLTSRIKLVFGIHLLIACFFLMALSGTAQTIRYVKAGGTGNGSSWASASGDLQAMINASNASDQVWVAGGTYKPTTNATNRSASFALKNNVAIYGGFVGTETSLTSRPVISPVALQSTAAQPSSTTLSGDINNDGTLSGNSYHVIFNNGTELASTAVLDGFVLTGGNANGNSPDNSGGAIYCSRVAGGTSNPRFTNCSFQNNSAASNGGAMCNNTSSPVLTNCSLTKNQAGREGGAIYGELSSMQLTNCILSDNQAPTGGAISQVAFSTYALTNCSLLNNTATNLGGAIFSYQSGIWMINCSLIGNVANLGGAMFGYQSGPRLTNCSLLNNQATTGGAFYNNYSSDPKLTNCVVFGNGAGNTIFNANSGNLTASYSLLENSVSGFINGGNNLTTSASPFVSLVSAELAPGSPAINTASVSLYNTASGPATDLLGQPRTRVVNAVTTLDMGALQYQGALPVTLTYFSGRLTKEGAVMGWQTAREVDNAYFQLERSRDLLAFEAIANVPTQAPGGISATRLTYSYMDTQPLIGVSYYRLIQVDRNGQRTPSKPVALSLDGQSSVVYPNPVPVLGEVMVEPSIAYSSYQLADSQGRVLSRSAGPGQLTKFSLAGLGAGVYILRVEASQGLVQYIRLLKE